MLINFMIHVLFSLLKVQKLITTSEAESDIFKFPLLCNQQKPKDYLFASNQEKQEIL